MLRRAAAEALRGSAKGSKGERWRSSLLPAACAGDAPSTSSLSSAAAPLDYKAFIDTLQRQLKQGGGVAAGVNGVDESSKQLRLQLVADRKRKMIWRLQQLSSGSDASYSLPRFDADNNSPSCSSSADTSGGREPLTNHTGRNPPASTSTNSSHRARFSTAVEVHSSPLLTAEQLRELKQTLGEFRRLVSGNVQGRTKYNKTRDEILQSYELLKRYKAMSAPPVGSYRIQRSMWLHTAVIGMCARALAFTNEFAQIAFEVYRSMPAAGCYPNCVTYSALVHVCSRSGDKQRARELFDAMLQSGIVPSSRSYFSFMDTFAHFGMVDDAFRVADHMIRDGFEPTLHAYKILSHAAAMARRIDTVKHIRERMRQDGFKPDSRIYTNFFHACEGSVDQRYAQELLQALKEDQIPSHPGLHRAIVRAFNLTPAMAMAVLEDVRASSSTQEPATTAASARTDSATGDVELNQVTQAHGDVMERVASSMLAQSSTAATDLGGTSDALLLELHDTSSDESRLAVLERIDWLTQNDQALRPTTRVEAPGLTIDIGWDQTRAEQLIAVRWSVQQLLTDLQLRYHLHEDNKGLILVPQSSLCDYAEHRKTAFIRQRAIQRAMLRYSAIAGLAGAALILPRLLSMC
eukprot:jgi/Chlat1/2290/Chrsp17S02797